VNENDEPMKISLWIYLIIFILVSFVLLLLFDLMFHKVTYLTSIIVMAPAYIITDLVYHKIEEKKYSLIETILRLASIICVMLFSAIIITPYYIIISIIESKWENLFGLLFIYLIGILFVYLSILLSSFVNKTKLSSEINNLFKHF